MKNDSSHSSNNSKYVTGKSVHFLTGKSVQQGFIRTPRSVQYDRRLSSSAVRVYTTLADKVGVGCTVSIGQRAIAQRSNLTQETVGVSLQELETAGHIEIIGQGKARRIYVLKSLVFGRNQGKRDAVERGPSGGLRYTSLDNERHGIR